MLRAMRERVERARRILLRLVFATPLFAIPGPCTTFDGDSPRAEGTDAGDAASDAGDAAPSGPRPYLSVDDAVRVCALVERCPSLPYSIELSLGVAVQAGRFGACVHALASPVPSSRLGFELQRGVLAKVATARTCQEALDATPTELLYGADPRCPVGAQSGCHDPTHAVYCGDAGYGTYSSCFDGHGGGSCLEIDVPDGGGKFGVCGTGPCDEAVPESRCEGTVVFTCDPRQYKLATAFDCAWLGLACARVADTVFTCVTPGQSDLRCPAFGLAQCDGDVARLCSGGEVPRWSTFACGDIGATCAGGMSDNGAGPPPFCLRKGADCSPLDAELGACVGTTIDLCVDGSLRRFDCASVGKQCDPVARACL